MIEELIPQEQEVVDQLVAWGTALQALRKTG